MAIELEPVPTTTLGVDEIRLGDLETWLRPDREGVFATLQKERPISFHEELDTGFFPKGPGFWALTKHADILQASRQPEIFCSGRGSNIGDLPTRSREFFGSMINMDDPRHARLRRIVSRGFTPRMVQRVEDQVQHVATAIVERVRERGRCDFVTDIAARFRSRSSAT